MVQLLLTPHALKELGNEKFHLLITRVHPRATKEVEEARKLFNELSIPVFKNVIHEFKAYNKAAAEGVTVNKSNDKYALRAWKEYVQVGKEIIKYEQKYIRTNSRRKKAANG